MVSCAASESGGSRSSQYTSSRLSLNSSSQASRGLSKSDSKHSGSTDSVDNRSLKEKRGVKVALDDNIDNNESSPHSQFTEKQLILLILDHLRRHRRTHSTSQLSSQGISAPHLSLAIWALSNSFRDGESCRNELRTSLEPYNDAFFDANLNVIPEEEDNEREVFEMMDCPSLNIPARLVDLEEDLLYRHHNEEKLDENDEGEKQYDYQDDHQSNIHRFYPLGGLANKPLSLLDVAMAGLERLEGVTRGDAENQMKTDQLFSDFVSAVKNKGFFDISESEVDEMVNRLGRRGDLAGILQQDEEGSIDADTLTLEDRASIRKEIYQERYDKVVKKFRTKLAAKAEAQQLEEEEMRQCNLFQQVQNQKKDLEDSEKSQSIVIYDDTSLTAVSVYESIGTPSETNKENQRLSGDDDAYSITSGLSQRSSSQRSASSRKSFSSVRTKSLDEAEKLKTLGNVSMQAKDYAKARDLYTAALELVPTGPTSHVYFSNRAAALLSMRKFSDAVHDSERSLALKPEYPKAHARLGLAYFLLGKYQEATNSYTMAVKLEPDNKVNQNYLEKSMKRYLASTGQHEDSENINNNISEKKSRDRNRDKGIKERDPNASIKKIKGNSAELDVNENQRSTVSSSDHESVRAKYQRLQQVKNDKNDKNDKEGRRQSSRHVGQSEERRDKSSSRRRSSSTKKNREKSEEEIEADRLKSEGNKSMARKEYENAIKCYSKALRIAPAGPSSHVFFSNRAAALCYLERYEEAELDSERSLALKPEYGKAHARLGLSRYFLRDYHGAIEAYESALQYDPGNTASQSYLAKAKLKLGKKSKKKESLS